MSTTTQDPGDLGLELQRVAEAARDSLTDEMVARLAGTAGDAVDLIDQFNRSGIAKAIPALAQMVGSGDLDRLVQLARVYASAEDSVTDEMVGRLAETVSEGLSLLDRLSRGGAGRFVEMMERMQSTGALERIATVLPKLLDRMDGLERLLQAADAVATKAAAAPPERGGLGGLWSMARDPETQTAMRFLLNLSRELRSSHKR